ncbi:MAG: Amylopullulanase precursor [Firmicutes bacterium ADurb.Bin182]|nr:MAG: Amylopullulanase precursor [Firmicutes bacterium ADurb.Bin182]
MRKAPVLRYDISHHSRLLSDRFPQGALKCGQKAELALHVAKRSNNFEAFLRTWFNGRTHTISGRLYPEENGSRVLFSLEMPDEPGLLWYSFLVNDNGRNICCGGISGESGIFECDPPAFRITVYDAAMTVPDWVYDAIAYQIFPDRFFRSNAEDFINRAAHHKAMGRSVYLHENWNEPVLYEPLPGSKFYEPCDFFGGDLEGIIQKLPYLQSLGISLLYLNPVFESPSNHRYNTSDYLKIDPILGGEGDLKKLSEKASESGMRLMLDGVFSHTGDDSVYFNRYGRYGGEGAYRSVRSEYYPWYDFKNWPDDYRCWWGFKTLPEVNETEPSYIEFIEYVLTYWAERGVTSWRLDVADELPDDFLKALYKKLKSLDPDGLLIGEVWEDASDKFSMGHRRPYTDGGVLDSVTNYPFRSAVLDFLTGGLNAFGLSDALHSLREAYPKPFYFSLLNILGSHDTERALSVLSGAKIDGLNRKQQACLKLTEEQVSLGKKRLKLASLIQFASPGIPCVYYSDEAGALGFCDPFNRGTYPWGMEDEDILAHYRLIACKRRESNALKRGLCAFGAKSGDVFFIAREFGNESVIAAVNRGETEIKIHISVDDFFEGEDAGKLHVFKAYRDIFSGKRVLSKNGRLSAVLAPLSGMLLESTECV